MRAEHAERADARPAEPAHAMPEPTTDADPARCSESAEPTRRRTARGRAEAVLGYDETIFAWCCRQLGGRDAHGGGCGGFNIGQNARLAETCIAASQSVLRLMNGWNLCRNTEWVMCAAQGRLPGQNTRAMRFSKAPKDLVIEEFWHPPAGCVNGCWSGYAVSDVFYVEACLLSYVCHNRRRLFELSVGDDFVCDLDAQAFRRLLPNRS